MIRNPRLGIAIGFVLVFLGFLLPFLMVLQVLESTFFLNFFSYVASVLGLFLGIISAAFYARMKK